MVRYLCLSLYIFIFHLKNNFRIRVNVTFTTEPDTNYRTHKENIDAIFEKSHTNQQFGFSLY